MTNNNQAFDIMAALQQAYQQQNKISSGLQDRLNKVDEFMNQTNPQAIMDTLGVKRAFGENPVDVQNARLTAGKEGGRLRQQAFSDVQSANSGVFDILSKMGVLQNQDRAYELDLLKLQNEGGNTTGLSLENGQLAIQPGADENAYLLQKVYNGEAKLKDFTPSQRGAIQALAGKMGVVLPSDDDIEKQQVLNIIKDLQTEYYGSPDASDDLSKGRIDNIGSWWKDITKGDVDGGRYRNYRNLRKGVTSTLKSLVGESGVLTDTDNKRIRELLPGTNATPQEAERAWQSVKNFINSRYGGKTNTPTPTPGAAPEPMSIGRFQIEVEN